MSKHIKQNLIYIIMSVAVNLLLAAIAIFVFGVRYCTDDDLSMAYMAYGIYMPSSARIVFSNIVIGWLMKTLFVLRTTINWQVVLYFAGLCVAGFVSLYEVIKTKDVKLYLLWGMFVVTFFYCSFVSITYTVVAAYVCCQGYLAFFLSVKEKNVLSMVMSGLILVYASLIRFESVLAISMYAAYSWVVMVLANCVNSGRIDIKTTVKRFVYPFAMVFLAIGMFYVADKLAYSADEWASYYEYYVLRGEVLDDCSIINMNDVEKQRELGISKAEAETLNAWYFNDPEVFDSTLFEKIDDISASLRSRYIEKPVADMVLSVRSLINTNNMLKVGLIVLLMLVISACFEKRERRWVKQICIFLSLLPFLIQIFAYCFMGRYADVLNKVLPGRLIDITIMGFFMCFILVESCFETDIHEKLENNKIAVVLLSLGFAVSLVSQTSQKYRLMGFDLKSESMIEEQYNFLNDGHIYVMEYQAMQIFMNEYRAWQNPPKGYLDNYIPLGGCEINYPLLIEKQNKMGVKNPYKALYADENVYLVSVGYPEIELNYLREVYDETIECELVENYDTVEVYNFVSR